MKKRLISLFALASASLLAQPAPPATFYKLDFTVKEIKGAQAVSSKTYSTMVSGNSSKCTIRAGSKVPVLTTPGGNQYTFVDVGTDIDCDRIKETETGLSMWVTAAILTMFRDPSVPSASPVVRQNRWNSEVSVPFKKTTLLFTADDPASKRQMQLELMATPVK